MAIEIREIKPTRSELRKFVRFPIDVLYRDHDYYVPDLVSDEIDTLTPGKNPAFDFCESVYYMAYRDGEPVGRIAGIINRVVNDRSSKHEVRFGFVDFINDAEVVDALFAAVAHWGRDKGMTRLTGPLGFTDMDPEGMLVEGYSELGTQATIYNHPYYVRHMERMAFEKDVDWVEYKVTVPPQVPERMARIAALVAQRQELHCVKYTNRRHLVADYGEALFQLVNEAYDNLFGYSPLTKRQIDHYIKMYLPFLPLEDLSLVVDKNDRLVAMGIAIPSLSRALQKSRGRLWPTGWYHLIRALKGKNDIVDLMLMAVKPMYQNKGVNAMVFNDLIPYFNKFGYRWAETNVEIESNARVQQQWAYFDYVQHKRRRAFTKAL